MQKQINLPSKPKITKINKNRSVFEIEGCYPGYGVTLGNALRRVLLSSLSGAAITGIKIKGVKHEFSTLSYVKEDIIQIILNLKQLRFKIYGEAQEGQPVKANLKIKGEKVVTAADIKATSEIEVINKDAHIATLTDKKAELDAEIQIESGLGYVPVEQRKKEKLEIGLIAVDAIFIPIRKVNFEVENMRVGERTDYNRLKFDIETDGSMSPEEAFSKAAEILINQFQVFVEEKKEIIKKSEKKIERKSNKAKEIKKSKIKRDKKK